MSVAPKYRRSSFNCPNCNVFSEQRWRAVTVTEQTITVVQGLEIATCTHCKNYSVWQAASMVHPRVVAMPLPNADMPADCKLDYEEARQVCSISPRAAAALLRLALQKLLAHLGEKGHTINDDIKSLVAKGLPVGIQKALDSIRVIGNNAVHPGELNIDDKPEIAHSLFSLINMVVDHQITQPKALDAIYAALPEADRTKVAKRDAASQKP